jgi:polysaccharide export outer membrane protein
MTHRPCTVHTPARAKDWSRRTPWLSLIVLTFLGIYLSACAPGSDLPSFDQPTETADRYRLGSGDQIRVITFGEDSLTGDFRVDDAGDVAMPLIGTTTAAGLTPAELAAKIEQQLRDKNLFSKPSVSVEVTKYRPIFILGEVTKPGEYPYQPGMTLLSAVSVAGGFTYRGIQDYASIVRSVGDKVTEGKVTRQAKIQPGDVITIFERRF